MGTGMEMEVDVLGVLRCGGVAEVEGQEAVEDAVVVCVTARCLSQCREEAQRCWVLMTTSQPL
jgi:hypothetical protein